MNRDYAHLQHIQEAIKEIRLTTESGKEQFINDFRNYRTVLYNLIIIGEAVNSLSQDFRQKHDCLPWRKIIGMRNKIVHDYAGIDSDFIWATVTLKLTELENFVTNFLDDKP